MEFLEWSGVSMEGAFLMSDLVTEKIVSTLASVKRISADRISLDSSLQDLGVDSLDTFTLLFELENQFQISIPDEEAKAIRSVKDIVEGVQRLLSATAATAPLNSPSSAD
jgi:acyl carrier protein